MDATMAVANVVRPSEKVQLVIDTSPSAGGGSSFATSQTRATSVQSTRRVIAVVTREGDGKEHGGLVSFVITRLKRSDHATN
jgi:hypothetical protein